MKKTLIVGVFAWGLLTAGCDDDTDAGNRDAQADGGDAGDARGPDGGKADGGAPDTIVVGDGGDAADALDASDATDVAEAAVPIDAVADMGGGGSPDAVINSDANPFATCTPPGIAGVSGAAFCTQVMTTCGFGAGSGKFADIASCMLKYNAYTADQKACAAYHACVAGTSFVNALLHCPHPVGAANNNPCNLPL